jgi:hypothetical protein
MEAGSDTTSSTLLAFVLAMSQHPEILKQAQEEVDRVCGSDRSPNFDDVEKLKYLRCCMNEVSNDRVENCSRTEGLTFIDSTMASNCTWWYPSYVNRG